MTIPDRAKVKLVYNKAFKFSTASGMDQAFQLNGIYQPGNYAPLSDATTSALGQKSWAQWYSNYYCGGSKIQVQLVNNSPRDAAASQEPIWFTLTPWGLSTLAADNTDSPPYQSTPYNKCKLIPLNASTPQKLSHYMSVNKFEGKKMNINDENYWGSVSVVANGFDLPPTSRLYWHLGVWNADQTVTTLDITYTVKITYYVTLFKRWQLAT